MTNAASNTPQSFLLLPKLKADSDVTPPSEPGAWNAQYSKTFTDVATSLDYDAPGQVKTVSAVPTMWSRPLTVEMALWNSRHPLHQKMVGQWQGMLAAIALAEMRAFPLRARFVNLNTLNREEFATALAKLAPAYQETALYTLETSPNPWHELYVFTWNDRAVGMTSPSTIVAPSEEGIWNDLPWWNANQRILESPIPHLDEQDQALLAKWLDNIHQTLDSSQGSRAAVNRIRELLAQYSQQLRQNPNVPLSLTDNPSFFGVQISRGVLTAINKPLKNVVERDSAVQLAAPPLKPGIKPLIIIDPRLPEVWGVRSHSIAVHQGTTLATPDLLTKLKRSELVWTDVDWIDVNELFLPKVSFLEQENAFLGGIALNYDGPQPIYNGQRITPILPINEKLLNYLTPEALNSAIKIQQTSVDNGPGVRFTLNLRLTGVTANGITKQDLSLQREYPLKAEQRISEIPVVELWPNFASPAWKTYYGFYYDGEFGNDTFQVIFPGAKEQERITEGAGNYLMARLEEFPGYIQCRNSSGMNIGVVLLPSPPVRQLAKTWKVGVDFGTSFTNIYVNGSQSGNREITPLKIKKLHLQITDSQFELRSPVLFEYFLPENFVPQDKPLPLATVLTHRGRSENIQNVRPMLDGRILIPNNAEEFKPDSDWIKTNLKWSIDNLKYNRSFLKNLMLYLSAIGAEDGVMEIIWSFSYPSAFSNADKIGYAKAWKTIAQEVGSNTGIRHEIPGMDDDQRFRTESIATGQFFADFDSSPSQDLLHTTCIDVGGGTSDISIWQENDLVHQCSVQLAGRDLFSQFLSIDQMRFLNEHLLDNSKWSGLKSATTFSAKLDVWLRLQADDWLQNHRDLLIENSKFQGLIRLITIGYAGLFYYVGIILKTLYQEKKLSREELTPIYMGGNASRFMNWLVTGGSFNNHSDVKDVLIRVFTQGTWFLCPDALTLSQDSLNRDYHDFEPNQRGFKEIGVEIYLSPKPKDEVACGLVLNDTRLKGLNKRERRADVLIAGERYKLHGDELGPETRFDIKGNVANFDIPTLPELQRFLYIFHKAIDELDPDEVTPLPKTVYTPSLKAADNEALWRLTQRRLLNTLTKMRQDNDESVRVEPPFILGLKALLQVLGEEWAKS